MNDGSGRERPRVALLILDGWGLREPADDNAVTLARTPVWDSIWESGDYPRARLVTHGPAVGLPEGQMGNSEVGHLNLGAGRVVQQTIQRITAAIDSGEFFENEALVRVMRGVRDRGGTLHLLGLIGPGGVHAVDTHLFALCEMACRHEIGRTRVHAFLDGRDTPPQSARDYLTELVGRIGGAAADPDGCEVATVVGRYWAMDRDRRWERTARAYDALVHGRGIPVTDPVAAIGEAYESGESDEFVEPRVVVDEAGEPVGRIQDGDAVVFFNFRADRVRQLSRALAVPDFSAFDRGPNPPGVEIVTMTEYDEDLPLDTAFPPEALKNTLAEVLAAHGRTSYRTAETEKYPHVTYFFSGGREDPFPGEDRILVPSPKVPTYDLQPEMSAPELAERVAAYLHEQRPDLVILNFANPDMVGHTGVFEAAVKAVEAVDAASKVVVEAAREEGYTVEIIADHGNADKMRNPDGSPHTAHTTALVPHLILREGFAGPIRPGKLGDIAPTILHLMGLEIPEAMTGDVLV